jgi:hypothetical protein
MFLPNKQRMRWNAKPITKLIPTQDETREDCRGGEPGAVAHDCCSPALCGVFAARNCGGDHSRRRGLGKRAPMAVSQLDCWSILVVDERAHMAVSQEFPLLIVFFTPEALSPLCRLLQSSPALRRRRECRLMSEAASVQLCGLN